MEDGLEKWKKAGKLASEAREYGKTLLKENANLYEVALKIEDFIFSRNAKPGFPVQISKNNIAAHYTPVPNDTAVINKGDVVKLDLGVHIDGYIGDTALTVEIETNNHKEIIEASRKALEAAISVCKPGIKINEIGKAISDSIPKNLKVIKNLSGHKIDRYILHSSISIPNYDNNDKTELEEGTIVAIEPHVSNGIGLIKDGKPSSNYRLYDITKNTRDLMARDILNFIKKEFVTLPFAARHLVRKFPLGKVNHALAVLEKQGILYQYPQLTERDENCVVSQHEHTIYISDPVIVLTK